MTQRPGKQPSTKAVDNKSAPAGTIIPPPKRQQPVFIFPDLPRWEYTLYMSFIFGMLIYAWYLIYDLSESSGRVNKKRLQMVPMFFGYGPARLKDVSDKEWASFRLLLLRFVPALIGHSLLFNGLDSLRNIDLKGHVMFAYSLVACMFVFGVYAVINALGLAVLMFTVAHYSRNKLVIWAVACPVLYLSVQFALSYVASPYHFLTIGMYNLCNYISYGCEMTDNNLREGDRTVSQRFYRMLQYAFYMPYIVFIIVPYNDWEPQMTNREKVPRDWPRNLLFCARVAFWFVFVDTLLHFCYMNTLIRSMKVMNNIHIDQLCALGYTMGQFFHMKYVVVFGLGCAFARIDRLTPYPPPMCIARVALYSKIWRAFDRGLYAFFKRYIFDPICAPSYTALRKTIAMMLVFAFVIVWHGIHHHNLVWVALNIWEIGLEILSKTLYTKTPLRQWRERNISDVAWRRLVAFLQVIPYTHALVSIFYFLGGSRVGWIFVELVRDNLRPTNGAAILLISIGYVYCQSCIQAELWQSKPMQTLAMK